MTGTSIDGIDAALVEITGEGLAMQARFLKGTSAGLGDLGLHLRSFANNSPAIAGEVAQMALDLGKLHVDVLLDLLGEQTPDLITLHGQTVFHKPPLSWQMINPWPVVKEFGAEVIYDLRGSDLIFGGQGAPITPLADFILFRDFSKERCIVNFGGFINYTYIPSGMGFAGSEEVRLSRWLEGVRGCDVTPCNQLLDYISRQFLGMPYDVGGLVAATGVVDEEALNALIATLTSNDRTLRSLGTGDEAFAWVKDFQKRLSPADLLRTACRGIATRLRAALVDNGDFEITGAGGGVKNQTLMAEVTMMTGKEFQTTDNYGVPAHFREAIEIAILGDLAAQGYPVSLPQITGRTDGTTTGCKIAKTIS